MNPPVNERVVVSPGPKAQRGKIELIPTHVRELLNLRRLPAMLTSAQTAALLDCGGEHNIPILIRTGLLKPLGNPPSNAIKYFATVEVLEMAADVERLNRIRNAVYEYWHGKNSRKSNCNRRVGHRIPDL